MNFFGLTETVTGFVLDSDSLMVAAVVGIVYQVLRDNAKITVVMEEKDSKDRSKR